MTRPPGIRIAVRAVWHTRKVAPTSKALVLESIRATSWRHRPRQSRFLTGRAAVLWFRPHHGAVAQLVAHLVRNEGVRGSSPLSSTDKQQVKALSRSGMRALVLPGAKYSSKQQSTAVDTPLTRR